MENRFGSFSYLNTSQAFQNMKVVSRIIFDFYLKYRLFNNFCKPYKFMCK